MPLQIERMSLDEIKAYPNNAKIHTAEQIEQIKESIRSFGFNDPIAIWHNEIVEGHGRFIAAQELGFKEIDVIRLDELSDEQRRAYMLVHNKLTMNTGFDMELLEFELENIDMDMEQFGFDGEISLDDDDDEVGVSLSDTFSVIIDCENESIQQEVYDTLTESGYKCRLSTL